MVQSQNMDSILINSELSLRLLTENDAAEVFALVQANRQRLRAWMPWVDSTKTEQDSLSFIRGCIQAESKGDRQFAIVHRNRIAGLVGFVRSTPHHKSSMMGYWLDEQEVGKGLITQSVQALLNLGFNHLAFDRIIIRAQPSNTRSCAVPQRLGFTEEGIQPKAELLNGVHVDLMVYVLLRSQWEKNHP